MRAWKRLLDRLHRDERGAVSIETILIVGAIALPILIFLLNIAWPRIRDYFMGAMDDLEGLADDAQNNPGGAGP